VNGEYWLVRSGCEPVGGIVVTAPPPGGGWVVEVHPAIEMHIAIMKKRVKG